MTNPLWMKSGNGSAGSPQAYYYYQNDHLGTPQKLLTQSGQVVWSATYDAFGNATIDPAYTITNNLRFPGQYYDAETGLHYNWMRYYDPRAVGGGRYITSDPIGLRGGVNEYAYVWGNPLQWYDPLGLAKSGRPKEIGNYIVRKDPAHVDNTNTQEHVHVYDKKNKQLITAINKDGSGSHSQCPDDLPKNKNLRIYIRSLGFNIPSILNIPGLILMYIDFSNEMNMTLEERLCKNEGIACPA